MDPLQVGTLILLLFGLAGGYLKINQAMRALVGKGESREISNDPLKVQETARPATIHDIQAVERRVTKIEKDLATQKEDAQRAREKINEQLTDMRDRLDDKFSSLSDDVREITRAVGRLEGS